MRLMKLRMVWSLLNQHGGSQQGDGGPGSPGKALQKPAGKATKPKAKGKTKGVNGW